MHNIYTAIVVRIIQVYRNTHLPSPFQFLLDVCVVAVWKYLWSGSSRFATTYSCLWYTFSFSKASTEVSNELWYRLKHSSRKGGEVRKNAIVCVPSITQHNTSYNVRLRYEASGAPWERKRERHARESVGKGRGDPKSTSVQLEVEMYGWIVKREGKLRDELNGFQPNIRCRRSSRSFSRRTQPLRILLVHVLVQLYRPTKSLLWIVYKH